MIGELCLAGAQISARYWKKPELTAEKFAETEIFDGKTVKIYHTGDLARYNEENQLEFCGRIDFQVKLRGFRIELGETAGKIDSKLLPTPNFSVRQSKYEPPINEIERKICSAFAKVLGLDENSVGRNDDFYFLGGDSIKSMIVMLTAGVDGLSAKDIFKNKTAGRISEEISARKRENIAEFEFQARKKEIPASAAQIQMIDYQFLNVNSTMYNLSGFYRLDAKLNAEKLAKAVEKVANHHPALNSVFDFDDESNIVQKIRSFSSVTTAFRRWRTQFRSISSSFL